MVNLKLGLHRCCFIPRLDSIHSCGVLGRTRAAQLRFPTPYIDASGKRLSAAELMRAGKLRGARGRIAQNYALVNRPVDTTAAQERAIGGVDDRVSFYIGDIALVEFDSLEHFFVVGKAWITRLNKESKRSFSSSI